MDKYHEFTETTAGPTTKKVKKSNLLVEGH
jgi:hypothetical protein